MARRAKAFGGEPQRSPANRLACSTAFTRRCARRRASSWLLARSTGKRHRLVDEDGRLLDLIEP